MNFQKLSFLNGEGIKIGARLDLPSDSPPIAYALFAHCFTCTKDIFAASRIAAGLAARVCEEESDDAMRIGRLFELCLMRQPTPDERRILTEHLEGQRRRHAGLADAERSSRVWTALARVLFNLDEFVTRE